MKGVWRGKGEKGEKKKKYVVWMKNTSTVNYSTPYRKHSMENWMLSPLFWGWMGGILTANAKSIATRPADVFTGKEGLVIRGKCDWSDCCIVIGWKSYPLCSKCFGFNCCFSDWLKMGQNGSIWLLKICRRNRDLEHLGSKNTCRRRNRDSKTPITKERVLFCM